MTNSVVTSILTVFTAIVNWFVTTLEDVSALFYNAETGLTFVGVVTIIGLGIAVTTLVIAWIRGLLRLQ